jgi:hypothetical protein
MTGLVTGWVSLAWPNDGVDHPAQPRDIANTRAKYGTSRANFPASFMAPPSHPPVEELAAVSFPLVTFQPAWHPLLAVSRDGTRRLTSPFVLPRTRYAWAPSRKNIPKLGAARIP